MENILRFDVPPLCDFLDRDEILCNLEALAISALDIAGYNPSGFNETGRICFTRPPNRSINTRCGFVFTS